MTDKHQATFTWGQGPQKVFVAGNFNNWSGDATELHRQEDGTFAAKVPMNWGEKHAFKYVVDGEWKVREDEAKEWDAAGNMNNVYTAPHAPEHAPAPAAAATSASPDTKPDTLLAASAPAAASAGAAPVLGAVATQPSPTGPSTASTAGAQLDSLERGVPTQKPSDAAPSATQSELVQKETATAAVPIEHAPKTTDPAPVKIEKTAANANIGEAPTTANEEPTTLEKAAEWGAGTFATLGAVVGSAAVALENATGVHVPGAPTNMSVEEAKSRGIDVDSLQKTDAATDATSPAGTAASKDGIAALDEKVKDLKVGGGSSSAQSQAGVPLPNGAAPQTSTAPGLQTATKNESVEQPKFDIPAQHETQGNHQSVPAPSVVAVEPKDPRKDRTLAASDVPNSDTAGTKPISSDPAVSAATEKQKAEANPATTGSTPASAQGRLHDPAGTTPAEQIAREKGASIPEAVTGAAKPTGTSTVAANTKSANAPVAAVAPVTPAKASPATPAKGTPGAASTATPASATSTPAKSAHGREGTSASGDVKKRKSGFLSKIKSAFSPKDKEKK